MTPTPAAAEGRSMRAALRSSHLRRLYGLGSEIADLIATLAWGGRPE